MTTDSIETSEGEARPFNLASLQRAVEIERPDVHELNILRHQIANMATVMERLLASTPSTAAMTDEGLQQLVHERPYGAVIREQACAVLLARNTLAGIRSEQRQPAAVVPTCDCAELRRQRDALLSAAKKVKAKAIRLASTTLGSHEHNEAIADLCAAVMAVNEDDQGAAK